MRARQVRVFATVLYIVSSAAWPSSQVAVDFVRLSETTGAVSSGSRPMRACRESFRPRCRLVTESSPRRFQVVVSHYLTDRQRTLFTLALL